MAKRDYTKLTAAEKTWIEETGRKVYQTADGTKVVKEECSRCGGGGRYSFCTAYHDRCFKCSGSGKQWSKVATVYARERRLANQRAKAEAATAAFEQLMETRGWVSEADLYEAARVAKAKQDRKAEEAKQEAELADLHAQKYLGTIGERITVKVTVENIIQVDGMYGTSWLHIITAATGEHLTYFTSGDGLWEYQGGPVEIRGTVKDHKVYEPRRHTGRPPVKQTILSRVTVTKKAAQAYEAEQEARDAAEAEEETAGAC